MNILKRQLALLLVLAMTLTMLPMPAHADEVTEPETKSVIVEETTEKTVVSKEEVFTNVSKMPVESAEPEASSKESATSEAETPADTVEDSDATIAEELVANTSKDAPVSDSIEESESIINIDGTAAEDTEADEDKDYSATVESEEAEDSESDTQEATGQAEPMTDVPVAAVFSFRRSVANAVTSECAHSETEIAWDTKDQVINCKSISDTQHQISGYQYRYCTSCYQRVGESFAATELAAHELDNSGYCSWCGYRSSTGSGSGSDSDSDSDCDHANTAIGWDPDQLGPWYAQYSDTQHKVTGYRYTYCTDCHARVRDESGSNNNYYSEELEGHTLNASGECTFCGYGQESACNHLRDSSSGEVSYTDPPRYEQFDEQTHYIYRPTYYDCIYCGEPMEEPGYTISNEPHAPENGVCIHCGYEVGEDYCPHLTREFVWDTDHSFTYEQHSDDEHIVRGYKYARCTSCLNRLADSYQSWDYENHSVNASGKCTLCGYESDADTGCTHENVLTGYAPLHDPPRYEQYNDTQHFVYHIFKKTCRDCGETLSDGEEVVSLEGHVLTNGKCNYCGYGFGEDYCTHPDTDVMWSSAPMTYTSLNEEQHEVEGCQYHYCTSCYKRICADFPVKEWEDHTFDSTGDCTLCNYRVGCEHKQTTMKLYDTLYESLNKDSHEVTRLYSKVCADPDCGKVLVSVETSYTETDIEDHDFTGNTCLLCNYTVADQLSATVTASGLTANKGDNISATVSVVGGTGGYRFSWKILKDSSVVAENPITTSASCGTNAYEEGSYVFQVTVTDSGGNTVTAQSGAITVSHACQYETVTSTELVIQSLTHHTVETTTYEECTICHEKRNEVTDVQWVEHTPIDAESYGHEAAHPHKKYFICECGAHPYLDGEYHTANGEVQDESVCCICHGHKFGAEEETDEDTRQKTCANCGIITVTHTHNFEPIETEKLINPDETKHERETTTYEKCKICGHEKPGITVTIDEPHSPKNPDDYKFRDGHPHLRYAVCECGKEYDMQDEYKTANGTMQAPDVCCLCHGHVFGEPTEINAVIWKRICFVCGYEDRIAAPSQTETEATEPPANTNEKQELKDYNIDFIKKNALGKNDIYTLFFNDELRAEIEELSEGNAAKGYDFIDGDPAAHLGYAQADYYVDTLMKQCAELDPDSDTIRVSPGELKAICKFIGLEDTVIEAILKEWVWDDRDGCIMEADEFKDKLDQYKDDTGATLLDGLGKVVDIGTFIWDCLSDISVYNAALDGSASAMIDAAVVHMKNSGIDQAQTAAEYIEDLKDPEKRITYIIMKNAGIAEKVRDTITGATGSIPAWDIAFEAATLLNGGLFRTNDVIKSNHGTYWSLQLVDELYRNLESSIAQYENISSDKNYTACMDAYSLYITYLISSYNGVLETRDNYSSSLVAQLITDKDVKEKEKALNEQYKAIMEWYEFDISAAINDFSIDQVVESIRDNGGFR